MTSFNSRNFKIGPCAVIFKGDVLGITKNSSVLEFKSIYYDVKCSQGYDQSLEKQLRGMTISLITEIMSVDNGLGLFFDEYECITSDRLGERQKQNGGELLLTPINPSDMVAYRFPNALLLRNSRCAFNTNEEHTLQLEFEASYIEEEQILFERISVDEGQRVSLDNTYSFDSATFERAMTAYIADKLNMTVDTDIFRGGVPVSIDGCGVELVAHEKPGTSVSQNYIIRISCIDNSRDNVMKTINDLGSKFPLYGEIITLDGGETVNCKAILNVVSEFSKKIADSGKIKTFGELLLEIII